MKKSFLSKLQVILLLTAVVLTGLSFLPADADAAFVGTCEEKGCDGGPYPCGLAEDPETGEIVRCKLSCT